MRPEQIAACNELGEVALNIELLGDQIVKSLKDRQFHYTRLNLEKLNRVIRRIETEICYITGKEN